MRQPTKKQKIAITVSGLWVLGWFIFLYGNSMNGISDPDFVCSFSVFGMTPILIGWAVWWIQRPA